jgi:hypothetical protein
MNNAMSNYLEDALTDHIFHASNTYTPLPNTNLYLGLHTADPTDAGGNETVYTNYARQIIAFGTASSRAITQNGEVTFPQCGATGATITHYGVYDNSTGGNLLFYGALTTSKDVATGNTPRVPDAEVVLTFTAGKISTYLADALLNFVCNGTAYSKPAWYAWLANASQADTDTGTNLAADEPTNNYAREQVTAWTTSTNTATNTSEILFNSPSGTWGAITSVGIADALTNGNILLIDNAPTGTGQTPTTGDTVRFAATAFDFSIE